MMLLHMMCTTTSDYKTFGDFSTKLFDIVIGMGYRYTAVVGDSYGNVDSIKSAERSRRGPVQMQEIRNPSSETPFPEKEVSVKIQPTRQM